LGSPVDERAEVRDVGDLQERDLVEQDPGCLGRRDRPPLRVAVHEDLEGVPFARPLRHLGPGQEKRRRVHARSVGIAHEERAGRTEPANGKRRDVSEKIFEGGHANRPSLS
jgi:hypothetical protein